MKLKKVTTLSLAIALCLSSMAVGCGKKLTPKEKLLAATEASSDIKSIDATYSMNINTPDGEFAKITGDMIFSEFMKNGKITQNMSLGGMSIEQTVYMKDEKSYSSLPMSDKFIVSENSGSMPFDEASMKQLQAQMLEKVKTLLDESEVTEVKEDGLNKLTWTLTDEQTTAYFTETINAVFTDEFFATIKEEAAVGMKTQLEAMGQQPSEEEINKMVEEQTQQTIELIKSVFTDSKFSNFTSTYYVDDKNNIKKADMSLTVDLADSLKQMLATLGLNVPVLTLDISVVYNSLNETVNVDFSELTEENTITMEDYAAQMGNVATTPAA